LFCGRPFGRMFFVLFGSIRSEDFVLWSSVWSNVFSFVRFDSIRGFCFVVVGLLGCFFLLFGSIRSEDFILRSSVWSNVFSFVRFGQRILFCGRRFGRMFFLLVDLANTFFFPFG